MKTDFSPEILKAGRVLTGLNQEDFAAEADIGVVTLRRIEGGGKSVTIQTIEKFIRRLEHYGVEYLQPTAEHGPGIRLAKNRRAPIAKSKKRHPKND